MVLSAHQPYFIPYLAYWQLIDTADIFLIADDYAFMKQGWINRNRILINGKPTFFRLEVNNQSSFRNINETELLPIDVKNKMKTIYMAYHKAPFYIEGEQLMESILSYPELNISKFLAHSIFLICDYLGITTPIRFTSDIPGNNSLHLEQRIYDFCEAFGADTYVNAIGGQELYRYDEFTQHGIKLKFISSCHPAYKQFGDSFVGQLSILDSIMFNSKEKLQWMLKQYTFIDE